MTTTKSYDNLNRLTAIQSSAGVSPVASFAYSYNDANQRVAVTNADSSQWIYQYDALGQVTSGKKYWFDGTPVAGQRFEYAFISNRASTKAGGDAGDAVLRSASYSMNPLNQNTCGCAHRFHSRGFRKTKCPFRDLDSPFREKLRSRYDYEPEPILFGASGKVQ